MSRLYLKARLKDNLRYGQGNYLKLKAGRDVIVVGEEDHSIYGKRYQVSGYIEWFEENAFETIQNRVGMVGMVGTVGKVGTVGRT